MANAEPLARAAAQRDVKVAAQAAGQPTAPAVAPPVQVLIDGGQCVGCAVCVDVCTSQALTMTRESLAPEWLPEKCGGCGTCEHECPTGAILVNGKVLVASEATGAGKAAGAGN